MARQDNLIPAKKGEVRNPKGRTVGSRNRSTIVKQWLERNDQERQKTPITEMAEILYMTARCSRLLYYRLLNFGFPFDASTINHGTGPGNLYKRQELIRYGN